MSKDIKAELVEMIETAELRWNTTTDYSKRPRSHAIADRLLASGVVAEQRAVGVDREKLVEAVETVLRKWTGMMPSDTLAQSVIDAILPLLQSARPTPWQAPVDVIKRMGGGLFTVTCDWDVDAYSALSTEDGQSQLIGALSDALSKQLVSSVLPNWLNAAPSEEGRCAWTITVFAANGAVVQRILDEAPEASAPNPPWQAIGWKGPFRAGDGSIVLGNSVMVLDARDHIVCQALTPQAATEIATALNAASGLGDGS